MKYLFLASDAETGGVVIAFFFFAILFVIAVFVTRWIFGINKILNHLKYQSYQLAVLRKLVCKMAAKEDITESDVKNILETTNVEHID